MPLDQAAIDSAASTGNHIMLGREAIALSDTLNINGVVGFQCFGRGVADYFLDSEFNLQSAKTLIYWDGDPGEPMFDIWNSGDIWFHNIMFSGRETASNIFRVRCPPGTATAQIHFRNCALTKSAIAVILGENPTDNLCSDVSFENCLFLHNDKTLAVMNEQALNIEFRQCANLFCGTVLDIFRGAHVSYRGGVVQGCDQFIKQRNGGPNAFSCLVEGVRFEMNGWTQRHMNLVDLHPADVAQVVMRDCQEAITGYDGGLPDNVNDPVFSVGPRGTLILRNHRMNDRPKRLAISGGKFSDKNSVWPVDPTTASLYTIAGSPKINVTRAQLNDGTPLRAFVG